MTPFADIEARMAAAVCERLGVTTMLDGMAVTGIFDAPYARGDIGGMGAASSAPTFTLPTSSVPPRIIDWFRYFDEQFDSIDLQMTVGEHTYQVVAHEPDGAISVLILERL